MIYTTLAALRSKRPCVGGYNKLVCHLTGQPYKSQRKYINCELDKPIPLNVILEFNGLDDALWALRACDQTPELVRAMRLYAVWCARQVQHLMTDPRSVETMDVAERHAWGEATDDELAAAQTRVWAAEATAAATAHNTAWEAAWAAAAAAAWKAAMATAWGTIGTATAISAAQTQKFIEVFCGPSIDISGLSANAR